MDSEVQINQTRPENDIAARIAMPSGRHVGCKCVHVKPLTGVVGTTIHTLTGYHIRAQRVGVSVIAKTRVIDAEWGIPKTRLPRPDRVQVPPRSYSVPKLVDPGTERLAPTNRQEVGTASNKTIADGLAIIPARASSL